MAIQVSHSRDRSLNEVVADLKADATLLVRQEIALAKAEAKEKALAIAKQAAFFGAAGVLAYAGLFVLLAALVLGIIALGVVAWLAALIVAIVVFAAVFVLVQRARHIEPSSKS